MSGTELKDSSNTSNIQFKEKLLDSKASNDRPDYILVFCNPYNIQDCQVLNNFNVSVDVRSRFSKFFCIDSDNNEILQASFKRLENLQNEFKDLPHKEFAVVVIKTLLKLIQEHLGLYVNAYVSADSTEIFVHVRSDLHNLIVQADLKDYKVQVSNEIARAYLESDLPTYQSVLPYAPVEKNLLELSQKVYSTYDSQGNPDSSGTIFKETDRVRLIKSMLTDTFFFSELETNEILKKDFHLHNPKSLLALQNTWANLKSIHKPQPFDLIKNYFGEEICIYFKYLNFLSKFLLFLSTLGLIFFVLITSYSDSDYIGWCLLIYSVIQALATTIFNQFWIREENYLAWQWGVVNLKLTEEQRPEYKGELKTDEVTGKYKKIYKPKGLRKLMNAMGYGTILFGAGLVIAGITPIFILKSLYGWGAYVGGIINAIQIKVFYIGYTWIATKMTDWENQETNREYFDSLTLKLFCFEFVNSYSSLLYIAFFKQSIEGCFQNDCMVELRYQILGIFSLNFIFILLEVQIPYIIGKKTLSSKQKRAFTLSSKLNEVETEASLNKYVSPLHEYMSIIINYGYSLLFSTAFPLLSLFTLVLILIEIRVDAWKLCFMTRRPFPMQSNSIGIWVQITLALSIIGILVNLAIALFTANGFKMESTATHWVIFLLIEHFLGVTRVIINFVIPDVPDSVKKGIKWGERIVKERILHAKNDDEKISLLGKMTKDSRKVLRASEIVAN